MPSNSFKNSEINNWSKYAKVYDPIKVGSIDGTDTLPHDKGILRACQSFYEPNKKVLGDPKTTIFIGRLHNKSNEQTLKDIFKKYGYIKNCRVVRDIITGASKCYGFVEYNDKKAANDAVCEMHNQYLDNCQIIVDFEFERVMKGWKPRRLGGGFGGKKESGQLRFGCRIRPYQKPIQFNNTSLSSSNLRDIFGSSKHK